MSFGLYPITLSGIRNTVFRSEFFENGDSFGKRFPLYEVIGLYCFCFFLFTSAAPGVIFDTDFHTDCDDDNALAVLHALADKNECVIKGIMCSDPDARIGDIRAINEKYGRCDIPIGLFNHTGGKTIHNATALYRRLLSGSPDKGIIIISVGYLSCLENLLKSDGDLYSQNKGIDLVRKKVLRWSCMGGDYPDGHEWNFRHYANSAAYTVANWPGKVIFNGYSIGHDISSGGCENRCRRSSWDPCAVLAGIRNPGDYWDLVTTGNNDVSTDGSNVWKEKPDKDHAYCVDESKWSDRQIAELLNELMCASPARHGCNPTVLYTSLPERKNGQLPGMRNRWITSLFTRSSMERRDIPDRFTCEGKPAKNSGGNFGIVIMQRTRHCNTIEP